MSLLQEYFILEEKYKKVHGTLTILLMQVGAFFEVYGKKDERGHIINQQIESYCNFCDLALANKTEKIFMAGFRDYMLEKYLRKIQDQGFTAVVYVQDNQCSNTTRSLQGIYSPGTYFSCDQNEISNNISCIWLHEVKSPMLKMNKLIIGMSNIDIITGRCVMFECENENIHNPSSYDELERFLSTYNPSECIFIHNFQNESRYTDLLNYVQSKSKKIHCKTKNTDENTKNELENCEKQRYILEIYNQFFTTKIVQSLNDSIHNFGFASQSFAYLLNFVYLYNPNLILKLQEPEFENNGTRLVLGNHSLKQLNIIEDHNYKGKYSSVLNFLNNCETNMGRRKFKFNLLHPTFCVEKLQKQYEKTDYLLENLSCAEHLKQKLNRMKDVEKLNRQIIIKKITPRQLFYLHESLLVVEELYNTIMEHKYFKHSYMCFKQVLMQSKKIKLLLEQYLDLSVCVLVDNNEGEVNIFNEKINESLDKITLQLRDDDEMLENIRVYFSNMIKSEEKNKKDTEYVKIHKTEKMGKSLVCTKRRGIVLKSLLDKEKKDIVDSENKKKHVDTTIQLLSSTTSNYTIQTSQVSSICNNLLKYQAHMKVQIKSVYQDLLHELKEYQEEFQNIIDFITELDILQNQTFLAHKNRYCKPKINEQPKSFVEAKEIRHVLVEHINKNETYVTNDLNMNEENQGILLYGTNAVGKTCLIRALGICIIMAQAGLYVPCSSFVYSPYQSLYTRILGNDNLFKGLSTFGVEMSELRVILRDANQHSLILGDELCSGTEFDSATSIFVAGLQKMYKNQCNFIFATHMHSIANYDEIKEMVNIKLKHLLVRYNKERDCLIYDRKLKEGCGESMYGLEVCESLHMDDDFLKNAKNIRNKYLQHGSKLNLKQSHYNSEQIVNMCEICKTEKASEVHHLQYQKNAVNNKIRHFHKNHKGNLVSICETCHNNIHKENKEYIKVKTSKGYIIEEYNN